jgi:hypothetical protein
VNPSLQKVKNWLSVVMQSVELLIEEMRYLGARKIEWPKCRSRIIRVQNVVHGTRDMKS